MASKLGTIYTDFTANTVGFERGANKVKSHANSLGSDLNKLAGLASRVFVGFSVAVVAKEMIQAGEAAKKYAGQLSLVVNESVGVEKAQADLLASAQRTRTGMGDNIDLYAKLARSTQQLGLSHERLIGVTESLNKAGIVSAATTQEQSNALRQLSQGLAAGALRGDELNSVMENTPRIAMAIADGMGITIGQLRKFGSEGKLTSEVVIQAIENQASVIDKEFKKMPVTIDQATVQLKNSLESLLAPMGGVNGAFVKVIQATTTTVEGFKIMGDYLSRYLTPIFKITGDTLSIISNSLLQIPSILMFDMETTKKLAADNELRMNRIAEAVMNYGKAIDETKPKVVDWGKTIFGDDKEIKPPKMPDITPFKFDQDMTGQVEEYYAHLSELANQQELTNQSLYSQQLERNQEYLNARLAQEQEHRWRAVKIAQEEAEAKKKATIKNQLDTINATGSFFGAMASIARLGGERSWKIYQAFAMAEALAAAVAGATKAAASAATAGPLATAAAYASVIAQLGAAAYSIGSISPGSQAAGVVGGTGFVPSTPNPSQPQEPAQTQAGPVVIITASGRREVEGKSVDEILDEAYRQIREDGREMIPIDSQEMEKIKRAVLEA